MVRVWPQCWHFLVVLGTRYGTLWPWCGQFEVGLILLQLLSGDGISWEVLVLVSQETNLYHIQIYPIWFEPHVWCKSLLMVSNLHSEQLSVGLCHYQGSLLPAGPLSHYPQCHIGLAPSRSKHMWLCRSVPRGGSLYVIACWWPFCHAITSTKCPRALGTLTRP